MENYDDVNQNLNNNQNSNDNGSATVSMVLGIISVVLCWVPIIGLVLGIVSLVLAVKGLKISRIINKGKGFSITGISCGSVGIALNVFYTLMWIFMGFVMKVTYDTIDKEINNTNKYNNSVYYRSYNYNTNSILDEYDIDL